MNYIYNTKRINDNYMFHNKELSNGDIVWGYEPKGKKLYNYSVDYSDNTPSEYGSIYEGTGTVTKKYKVVEVNEYENISKLLNKMWCDSAGNVHQSTHMKWFLDKGYIRGQFIYKLEKIADVSMELSEFVSWNKLAEYYSNITRGYILGKNDGEGLKYIDRIKPLTRYNGLTSVILRSDGK